MTAFLDAIAAGPLLLDAAMGTRLIARGLDPRHDDAGLWNLTHPDDVLDIHRRDIEAGADALVANTFGLSVAWLKRFDRDGDFEALNRRALELARQAAGPDRFVIGGMGPTAGLEPGSAAQQAAFLIEHGANALMLETHLPESALSTLEELRRALPPTVPIIVSLWQWPEAPRRLARRMLQRGASVLGMNCQPGALAAVRFAHQLADLVSCPLLVKPSTDTNAKANPACTPSAFASAVPDLLTWGVRLLGGCCGTTEAHIAAMASALRARPPHAADPISIALGSPP
jgi:5-methyltetrahydrofolate--homocysteine methyltransferase